MVPRNFITQGVPLPTRLGVRVVFRTRSLGVEARREMREFRDGTYGQLDKLLSSVMVGGGGVRYVQD